MSLRLLLKCLNGYQRSLETSRKIQGYKQSKSGPWSKVANFWTIFLSLQTCATWNVPNPWNRYDQMLPSYTQRACDDPRESASADGPGKGSTNAACFSKSMRADDHGHTSKVSLVSHHGPLTVLVSPQGKTVKSWCKYAIYDICLWTLTCQCLIPR